MAGADTEDRARRIAVRVAGTFEVAVEGRILGRVDLGSRKGRTLLKLLVVNRGRVVPTDRIVDVIWGDEPPAKPEDNVAVLVSRLRGALGVDLIAGGRDGYRFVAGQNVAVDIEDADRLVCEAERRLQADEPALARSAADAALAILGTGSILDDEPYADWAESIRTDAGSLLRRARRAGWEAASATGNHTRAATLADAAIADDALDEEAARALMRAQVRNGNSAQALATFDRLRNTLAEALGADPSPESEALHLSVLRGTATQEAAGGPRRVRVTPVRPAAADPGFFGRENELASLAARWTEAASGLPSLLAIRGEAGIGKTSLARELGALAEATGGRVVRARCYEAERSLFLQPVIEAIRTVALSLEPDLLRDAASERTGTLADLVPEIGRILRPHDYIPASPELERRRAFEAVTAFWLRISVQQPTLLVLDDLHNADSSTVELLHFLARRQSAERSLILVTVRSDEGEEALAQLGDRVTTLDLGPLDEEAVGDLARAMGAPELGPKVHALARGHPLFAVEALRALKEQDISGGDAVPETLRAAVTARLRRSGPKVEDLLRAASVLGSSFDLATAARLTSLPEDHTAELAETALRARLIVESGDGYEFANDLIREVVYRTTPAPTRVMRHRRAAILLAGNPEAVATHAAAGGEWALALRSWLDAAALAVSRFANRDAEELMDRALEAAIAAEDPAGEALVRLERGKVRHALGNIEGSFDDQDRALTLARATGERSIEMQSLREHAGDLLVARGLPTRRSIPLLEAALQIAEELGDRRMENSILSRLAVIFGNCLEFDRMIESGRRALERARESRDEDALAWALDGMKMVAAHTGDFRALQAYVTELERLVRPRNDITLLEWALLESAFEPMARARWDEAVERMHEALTLAHKIDDAVNSSWIVSHLAWIERSRGDLDRSLELGLQALSEAEAIGHPWCIPFAEAMVGWTLEERSDLREAAAHLRNGLVAAERTAAEFYLVRCLAHLARTTWHLGDTSEALGLAARAETMLRAVRTPRGTAFLHGAHAYVAAGDVLLAAGEIIGRVRSFDPCSSPLRRPSGRRPSPAPRS